MNLMAEGEDCKVSGVVVLFSSVSFVFLCLAGIGYSYKTSDVSIEEFRLFI